MVEKRSKRGVTLDSLASMVKRGFDDVTSKMALRVEVDHRFDTVDREFAEVHRRFDKLEKLILADHKRRIERLEEEVKELKELLRIP